MTKTVLLVVWFCRGGRSSRLDGHISNFGELVRYSSRSLLFGDGTYLESNCDSRLTIPFLTAVFSLPLLVLLSSDFLSGSRRWGGHLSISEECITTGTLTAPSLYCVFADLPQFLNTLNLGELVFPPHTAMCWICGTTTGSCTTLSSTIGKLNNSTSQTSVSVSSVVFIWLLFVCVSPSVLFHQSHTSSSLFNPLLIFFQWICFYSKKIARVHPRRPSDWAISFLKFFAQALLDISLGLSWQLLMCSSQMTRAAVTQSASLLVSSSMSLSCFSTNFVFSGSILFWSSTQTI